MITRVNTQEFLDPGQIVQNFGLKPGDHAADFGAGHGYFTMPLARAVGRNGKIWAIDIQPSSLDLIRSRARSEHLLNIVCVRADLDNAGAAGIADNFADFVLIANILFQAERREAVVREAWRILRQGGRLAMIEWDAMAGPVPLGPPREVRIKKDLARAIASQAGFELDREFAAGPHHYGLLFIKR